MTAFTDRLTDSFLDAKRQRCDAPVDEVIDDVFGHGNVELADRTFHTLIRHLEIPVEDLPAPLAAFVRAHAEAAPGMPAEVAARAERVFRDHGPRILLSLCHASLPTVYASRSIARLLVGTGRLAHDASSLVILSRRIAETGQYVIDVLGPGGMQASGAGVTMSLKVRLIHGAVRHFTRAAGWDTSALGEPINQEEMALTLMTFGVTIVDALSALGTPLGPAEAAAYLETWNAAGTLLGIDEDLLPPTADDARHLLSRILERQAAETADGGLLTRSLVEYTGNLIAGRDLRDAPVLLIRYLVGDRMAEQLAVPRPRRWWMLLIPSALRRVFGLLERLEDSGEPVARLSDRLSGRMVRGMVASPNAFKGRPFRVPGSLQEVWGLRRPVEVP